MLHAIEVWSLIGGLASVSFGALCLIVAFIFFPLRTIKSHKAPSITAADNNKDSRSIFYCCFRKRNRTTADRKISEIAMVPASAV